VMRCAWGRGESEHDALLCELHLRTPCVCECVCVCVCVCV